MIFQTNVHGIQYHMKNYLELSNIGTLILTLLNLELEKDIL
jgi:hypothetical protein